MMKWLEDALQFFKKEKVYTAVLLIALACLIFSKYIPEKESKPAGDSPAVAKFEKAEDRLREKIKKAGSIEKFMDQNPQYKTIFTLLFFLTGGALGIGIVLDGLLFFVPHWRNSFTVKCPEPEARWNIAVIFIVISRFLLIGFFLSGVIAFFLRFIPALRFSDNFYLLFHTMIMDIIGFLLILDMLKRAGGVVSDIGLAIPSKNWFKELFVSWGFYLAMLPLFISVMLLLMILSEIFHYAPEPHALVDVFLEEDKSSLMTLYSIFLGTIIGPILEEIFFRGFCYNVLKQRFGISVAMVVTSSFFAFIHGNTFAFWPVFILGMGLNYLYEKRGTLFSPIILHITHNSLFIAYFFIAKQIVTREGGF